MRETIDGAVFTDMLLCASAALTQNSQHINDLNVFPVPDGDTGTNMSMTMESGATELRRKAPQGVGEVAKCAANSFLRGARGNSGVILSLLFRGMSKSLKGKDVASAYDFAQAMNEGVDSAYKAVMKPAEGTILTVSRLAASAASDFASTGTDIELMLSCALESAKEALAQTMELNPVLKKAGVSFAVLKQEPPSGCALGDLTGYVEDVRQQARAAAAAIAASGAKKLVVLDS